MSTNPMKRKSRISFLLGILVTLLITGAIIALLFMQILRLTKEKQTREETSVYAYVVKQEIKSGADITDAQLTKGVEVVLQERDSLGNIYESRETMKNQKTGEIEYVQNTDGTYSTKAFPAGLKAKVDLRPGTVLTSDLTYQGDPIGVDERIQEYNMIKLSSKLKAGDTIDIRLRLPSGLDYLVISKKEVQLPKITGVDSLNTIWLNMTEAETLIMSEAIVEAYMMDGAILYTTNYVQAGTQEALTPTYVPNGNVQNLIYSEPNIVNQAKNALIERYRNSGNIREHINSELPSDPDQIKNNINTGVSGEVKKSEEQRKAYLDSLAGR